MYYMYYMYYMYLSNILLCFSDQSSPLRVVSEGDTFALTELTQKVKYIIKKKCSNIILSLRYSPIRSAVFIQYGTRKHIP